MEPRASDGLEGSIPLRFRRFGRLAAKGASRRLRLEHRSVRNVDHLDHLRDATEGDRPGKGSRDLLGGMTIERWMPSQTYTRQETAILKSLRRTRKLFAFLRDHRHEIFDDEMQSALEAMY